MSGASNNLGRNGGGGRVRRGVSPAQALLLRQQALLLAQAKAQAPVAPKPVLVATRLFSSKKSLPPVNASTSSNLLQPSEKIARTIRELPPETDGTGRPGGVLLYRDATLPPWLSEVARRSFPQGGAQHYVSVHLTGYDLNVWVPYQIHGNKVVLLQGNGEIVELSLPARANITSIDAGPIAQRINELVRQGKFEVDLLGRAPYKKSPSDISVIVKADAGIGQRWSQYLESLPDSARKTALQTRLNQVLRGELTGGVFSAFGSVGLTYEAGGPAYQLGLLRGMRDVNEGLLNALALQPPGTIKATELRRAEEALIAEARRKGIDIRLLDEPNDAMGRYANEARRSGAENAETRALYERGKADAQGMLFEVAGGVFELGRLLPKANLQRSNTGNYFRLQLFEINNRKYMLPIDSRGNVISVAELRKRGGDQWRAYQKDIAGMDQRLVLPLDEGGASGTGRTPRRPSGNPPPGGSVAGGMERYAALEGRLVKITLTGVTVEPTLTQGTLMRQMAVGNTNAFLLVDGMYLIDQTMKKPQYYQVLTGLRPGEQIQFPRVPVGPSRQLVDITVTGTPAGGRPNGGTLAISVKRAGAPESEAVTLHPAVSKAGLDIAQTVGAAQRARAGSQAPGEAKPLPPLPAAPKTSYRSFEKLREQLGANTAEGSAARAWVDGAWDLQQRLKNPKIFEGISKLKPGQAESYPFNWDNGAGQTIPLTVTVAGASPGVVAITVASPWGTVTMMPELGSKGAPLTMINDAVRDLERVRGQSAPTRPARDSNIPTGAKDCSQAQLVGYMPAGTRDNVIGWNNAFRNEASAEEGRSGQVVWQSIRGGAVETFTPPNSGEFRIGPGEKGKPNTYTIYAKDPKGQWWKSTFNGMPNGSNPQDGTINLWSPDGTGFGRPPSALGGATPTSPTNPAAPSNAPIRLLNPDIAARGSNDTIFKDLVWLASDGRALTAEAIRGVNSNDPPRPLREGGLPVRFSKGGVAGTVKITWYSDDGKQFEYSPVVKPDGTLDRAQLPSAVVKAIPNTSEASPGIPSRVQALNVSQDAVLNAGPRDVAKLRLRDAINAYAGGQRDNLPGGVTAVERVRGALDFIDPSTGVWTSVKFKDSKTDAILWDPPGSTSPTLPSSAGQVPRRTYAERIKVLREALDIKGQDAFTQGVMKRLDESLQASAKTRDMSVDQAVNAFVRDVGPNGEVQSKKAASLRLLQQVQAQLKTNPGGLDDKQVQRVQEAMGQEWAKRLNDPDAGIDFLRSMTNPTTRGAFIEQHKGEPVTKTPTGDPTNPTQLPSTPPQKPVTPPDPNAVPLPVPAEVPTGVPLNPDPPAIQALPKELRERLRDYGLGTKTRDEALERLTPAQQKKLKEAMDALDKLDKAAKGAPTQSPQEVAQKGPLSEVEKIRWLRKMQSAAEAQTISDYRSGKKTREEALNGLKGKSRARVAEAIDAIDRTKLAWGPGGGVAVPEYKPLALAAAINSSVKDNYYGYLNLDAGTIEAMKRSLEKALKENPSPESKKSLERALATLNDQPAAAKRYNQGLDDFVRALDREGVRSLPENLQPLVRDALHERLSSGKLDAATQRTYTRVIAALDAEIKGQGAAPARTAGEISAAQRQREKLLSEATEEVGATRRALDEARAAKNDIPAQAKKYGEAAGHIKKLQALETLARGQGEKQIADAIAVLHKALESERKVGFSTGPGAAQANANNDGKVWLGPKPQDVFEAPKGTWEINWNENLNINDGKVVMHLREGNAIDITSIWRGSQPPGAASRMITDCIRNIAGVEQPPSIRISRISENQPTIDALNNGAAPADTVLGKVLTGSSALLGAEVVGWRKGQDNGVWWIEAVLRYRAPNTIAPSSTAADQSTGQPPNPTTTQPTGQAGGVSDYGPPQYVPQASVSEQDHFQQLIARARISAKDDAQRERLDAVLTAHREKGWSHFAGRQALNAIIANPNVSAAQAIKIGDANEYLINEVRAKFPVPSSLALNRVWTDVNAPGIENIEQARQLLAGIDQAEKMLSAAFSGRADGLGPQARGEGTIFVWGGVADLLRSPIPIEVKLRKLNELANFSATVTTRYNSSMFGRDMGNAPTSYVYGGRAESGLFAGLGGATPREARERVFAKIDQLVASGRLRPIGSQENPGVNGSYNQIYFDTENGAVIRVGQVSSKELADTVGLPNTGDGNLGAPIDVSQSLYIPGLLSPASSTSLGLAVLVMPNVGQPFKDVFPRLSPEKREAALESLFDAVVSLHMLGRQHNDLHMSNVLYNERTGRVTIIDFGRTERRNPATAGDPQTIERYRQGSIRQLPFERDYRFLSMILTSSNSISSQTEFKQRYRNAVNRLKPPVGAAEGSTAMRAFQEKREGLLRGIDRFY
jgi:Lipopolysaccharide kinase (Kdo/WaaP) family